MQLLTKLEINSVHWVESHHIFSDSFRVLLFVSLFYGAELVSSFEVALIAPKTCEDNCVTAIKSKI